MVEAQDGALQGGLRCFVCTDHASHWPVGCASVVVAHSEVQARGLLDDELKAHGLSVTEPYTLVEIGQSGPVAQCLRDGQY